MKNTSAGDNSILAPLVIKKIDKEFKKKLLQ